MYSIPLTSIPETKLRRSFQFSAGSNYHGTMDSLQVSGIDITSNGAYAFAALSNGLLLLFDLLSNPSSNSTSTSPSKGHIVGRIEAKGLHTKMIITIRTSEDSRFLFAGAHKGSVEMLALDIGALPNFSHGFSFEGRNSYADYIYTYKYLNQKLRGFDAVALVKPLIPSSSSSSPPPFSSFGAEYRLVCGKGIKNVHIWSFFPDYEDSYGNYCTCFKNFFLQCFLSLIYLILKVFSTQVKANGHAFMT